GLKLVDLDALAFGRGPGAFTGVRIATGVIQGLAFGAGIPVVPVSSLAALAQGVASRHSLIMSAFDARMGEIYWGPFKAGHDGLVVPLDEEKVERPDDLTLPEGDEWFGVGTGWSAHGDTLLVRFGARLAGFEWECYPHAGDILALARRGFAEGKAVTAEEALPVYLRNKVTG
ncbi:MAG: tRNA (adenosine(37)-N6)-threonylcarbamoyltransferase complex dimerization subunit type 1 TsaB, partial [Gammaproteobacteria bacterium]|nr:tRNA (adenosine(37)-N6)-threonylcarbamoyltransferase complex dimerization subunit type 1 TsaB [Gammaproteobacteria bacterium]